MRTINQLDEDNINQIGFSKIKNSCILSDINCKNERIFVAGRYRKLSRNLSQTPWIINDKERFMSSVQEEIISSFDKFIEYKEIKFCASGREDVDVRMLGNGRPFLLEISNPIIPDQEDLFKKITQQLNESNNDVQVKDLQIVNKDDCHFLKEGEEMKTKTYKVCKSNKKKLIN